jgi:hypothetical protein
MNLPQLPFTPLSAHRGESGEWQLQHITLHEMFTAIHNMNINNPLLSPATENQTLKSGQLGNT